MLQVSVNQPTDSRMMTPAAREISIYPSNMARITAPLSSGQECDARTDPWGHMER